MPLIRKSIFIESGKQFIPEKIFRPNDMWLSSQDLMFVNQLLYQPFWKDTRAIANLLVTLSHILTTCVMSDRITFSSPKDLLSLHPFDFIIKQITKRFTTVRVDTEHKFMKDWLSYEGWIRTYSNLDEEDEALYRAINEGAENAYQMYFDNSSSGQELRWIFLIEHLIPLQLTVSYMPNPFISSKILPAIVRKSLYEKGISPKKAENILLSIVDDLRRETTQEYNRLREMDIYDVKIPSLFSVILRDSKNPDDLFRIAKLIHDEAADFRKWCRKLNSSKDPLRFSQGVQDAQNALRRLGRTIDSKRDERIQISLIPGILKKSVTFASSKSMENIYRRAELDTSLMKPIGFLLTLLQKSRQVSSLKEDLIRVFGFTEKLSAQIYTEYIDLINSY